MYDFCISMMKKDEGVTIMFKSIQYVLKENLRNKEEDNYKEFIVPKYIEDAIKWVCE